MRDHLLHLGAAEEAELFAVGNAVEGDASLLVLERVEGEDGDHANDKTHYLAQRVMQRHNVLLKNHRVVDLGSSASQVVGGTFHHADDAQRTSNRCHDALRHGVAGEAKGVVKQYIGEQVGDDRVNCAL